MSDLTHPGHAQQPDEFDRSIEVRLDPAATRGYAGVVSLRGEHDLSTAVEIQDALEPIFGNVLVDLSGCDFIDSTVIAVLLDDSDIRKREGHCLELLVPPDNRVIMRTLQVSGIARLLVVHSNPETGAQAAPGPA
jgi:anti-anti-sigma factor